MKMLAMTNVLCMFALLFALAQFIDEKRARISAEQTLAACEVNLDRAVRIMTKRQQWKFTQIANGVGK